MCKIQSIFAKHFNKILLPILILIISIIFNVDKLEGNEWKFLIHTFLQSIFLYGLFGLLNKWQFVRIVFGFLVALSLFIKMSYGAPLNIAMIMSAINTSPSETWSFIQFNLTEVIVCILIFWGLSFLYVLPIQRILGIFVVLGSVYIIAPSLLDMEEALSSNQYKHHQASGLARGNPLWFTKIEYLVTEDMARRLPLLANIRGLTDTVSFMMHETKLDSSWEDVRLASAAENILVVGIGESLRAGNMAIYGYDRNTTPVLSNLKEHQIIDVFGRAYAAGTNTWSAIPAALSLTKIGARADLSKSVINLARDAGYKVIWLSNQPKYSEWDFSVNSIANQADESIFFSDSLSMSDAPKDEVLVSALKKILENKGNENILVFLHFYGSHALFSDRYPTEFEKFFGEDGNPDEIDQYDNSVLYTDYIQGEIINIIREVGGKYLFFADHGLIAPGNNLGLNHDVREDPDVESIWVPLIVYPKGALKLPSDKIISLYYFECVFSKWSGITAPALEEHCNKVMRSNEVRFLDSRLNIRREIIRVHQ